MIPEPIGTRKSLWGEGPLWHEGRLIYVDIEGHAVVIFDPSTGEEKVVEAGERVGCVVPRASGGLVIGGDNGYSFIDPDTATKTPIADPEPEMADNRFNDGKCDPSGRFWAGSMSCIKDLGTANLYRLDADHSLHTMKKSVTTSNGIGWTADGKTMFYIDTPTKKMVAFDFDDATGSIANEREVIDFPSLGINDSPDGLAVDAEGKVWVAICHGAMVGRFDPETGKEIARIEFPCIETTACAFGGENLDQLYVTTGIKNGLDEPEAGRVFVADPGVRGVPSNAFAG
ncbi:MAG: SMP-30/gluconolactonase/LRE family protein [Verrucomicrobiota bacterium]